MGHPEILVSGFNPEDELTNIAQYFGIAQVKVLPPKGLYHPVLPYKNPANKKLLFALCKTCADAGDVEHRCTCSDAERAFVGM